MAQPTIKSAAELRATIAAAEAERARKRAEEQAEAEQRRRTEVEAMKAETLTEQRLVRIRTVIEQAIARGAIEVELMRFPVALTSDRGRAINAGDARWPDTLLGVPSELVAIWRERFKDKGYQLKSYITAFPEGVPGEAALILSWAGSD